VPIPDFLKRQEFLQPKEAATVCEVFEDVLKTLGLVDRQDILTTMIARKLVELAKAGVRDPVHLKQRTIRAFEGGKPD
jgi:hypothetical protein